MTHRIRCNTGAGHAAVRDAGACRCQCAERLLRCAQRTDAQNTERIFPFTGGSRFIQNGVLTLAQTRNFGYALMACVVAAGCG